MLGEEEQKLEKKREELKNFVQQCCPECDRSVMEAFNKTVNKPVIIRHIYKDTTWYAIYINRIIKYYETLYDSPSGFAVAHMKHINEGLKFYPKTTSTNGWDTCSFRNEEGEWVKLDTLR